MLCFDWNSVIIRFTAFSLDIT